MSNAAFVLMNCDLVAVPLQVGGAAVTIYCGARRATQLLGPANNGFGSVDLRDMLATTACERMYAQSASGSRSSQRTAPPDSRSNEMQSSALNFWSRLTAFRRYPSVVPQAAAYAARASFSKELRYLSNLSIDVIYPQVK